MALCCALVCRKKSHNAVRNSDHVFYPTDFKRRPNSQRGVKKPWKLDFARYHLSDTPPHSYVFWTRQRCRPCLMPRYSISINFTAERWIWLEISQWHRLKEPYQIHDVIFQAHAHHYLEVDGFESEHFHESREAVLNVSNQYKELQTQRPISVPRLHLIWNYKL